MLGAGELLLLLSTAVAALVIAGLSAWATLRAFAAYQRDPNLLVLSVVLAWFVPVIGPIFVLIRTRKAGGGDEA